MQKKMAFEGGHPKKKMGKGREVTRNILVKLLNSTMF